MEGNEIDFSAGRFQLRALDLSFFDDEKRVSNFSLSNNVLSILSQKGY
jgi:hypothetical protein